jgi:hypothetical protein
VKEGGKRGVEIEGAADMGGLGFFCTTMEEPAGDVDLLYESMRAMNFKSDPSELAICWGDFYTLIFTGGPPRPPEIVALRPPRLSDLHKKSYMNQGGRRPTVSGGLGGRAP